MGAIDVFARSVVVVTERTDVGLVVALLVYENLPDVSRKTNTIAKSPTHLMGSKIV